MERPRSLNAYNEQRERPDGGGFSDSSYNFLNRKIAEMQKAIREKAVAEKPPMQFGEAILKRVSDLYESRSFNLSVQGQLEETLQKLEQAKEKKEIAEGIALTRKEADMEEDPELQRFIEDMDEEVRMHQEEADRLSEAVDANEKFAEKRIAADPKIMAKMEEDAYEEDSKRVGN